ncbi:MAG: sigma 54-interacting transcriptional regulator [Myxococcales bacterium]|nr:sigma 54-interacting transcriptional regulator [Myxococcales bacterium]
MPSAPLAGPLASVVGEVTEEQLRFWQSVVDTMNGGLMLVDADRRVIYLNRKAEELTGARVGEAPGALCTDAINCPQCSCRCRLFEEGDLEGVEVTIYHAATRRQRTLLKNARLLRDADGKIVCGIETFQDISGEVAERTEAKRTMQLLFAEKNEKEALLAALPEGVCALDEAGRVLRLSPRMAELLDLSPAAAIGSDLFELLGIARPWAAGEPLAPPEGRCLGVTLRDVEGASTPAVLSLRAVPYRDDEVVGILRVVSPTSTSARRSFHGILSEAPSMAALVRLVESAGASDSPILIEGESGTGKELVARAIHAVSARREEPFHAVNCATFQGSLLLSELFGHERGAFTGAYRTARGKLELAGAGTLFLDEVSQIPLHYQGVLLRVLEERSFERVGGSQRIPLHARIVSATNERLAEAVRAGRFREDLFYRLRVVPIWVPPLRERACDIDLLVDYFIAHPAVNLKKKPLRLTEAARQRLRAHAWPGNVRELRNLVEFLCFLPDELVDVTELPADVLTEHPAAGAPAAQAPPSASPELDSPRARLVAALERAGGARTEAARLLGIDRTTLWRRMRRLGVR